MSKEERNKAKKVLGWQMKGYLQAGNKLLGRIIV
jgi:hypothetical protein